MKPKKNSIKENEVLSEKDEIIKKYNEIKKQEQDERVAFLASIKVQTDKILDENGLFAGIILTKKDLLNIIDVMIQTNESIRIPYKLYFHKK